MYNKVVLMGRIAGDLELIVTPSGVPVLSFRIAVDRSYVAKGEERKTDFINCVAWRNTAEFISRFFHKGSLILCEGELQTRQYQDKEGKNHTVTEVVVSSSSFTGEKRSSGNEAPTNPASTAETAAEPTTQPTEDYPF